MVVSHVDSSPARDVAASVGQAVSLNALYSFFQVWYCMNLLAWVGTLGRWFAGRSLNSLKLKVGQCV